VFEHRAQPLLPWNAFTRRILRYAGFALGMVLGSWLMGAVGYRVLEGMGWVDAILNAAMILGGMGPVNELHTTAGKLFASVYALFAGIVFLMAVGVILAPIAHRLYHRFHLEVEPEEKGGGEE
jgi:hypothetical protein